VIVVVVFGGGGEGGGGEGWVGGEGDLLLFAQFCKKFLQVYLGVSVLRVWMNRMLLWGVVFYRLRRQAYHEDCSHMPGVSECGTPCGGCCLETTSAHH
jgi:hypothetical protein